MVHRGFEKNFWKARVIRDRYALVVGICYLKLRNFAQASLYFNKDFLEQQHGDSSREIHYNSLLYMGITKLESRNMDSAEFWLLKSLHIYGLAVTGQLIEIDMEAHKQH